jgi:rhodanese-related sulfurtransferase
MRKSSSIKSLVRWTDILVIGIFFTVVAFLFYQSRPQISWMEAQMQPSEAQEILMSEIYGTPLHPEFDPQIFSQRFKTFRISLVGWLSEKPFTNRFVHYFNTLQNWVADCSSCSDEEVCTDLEKEILPYPLDITNTQLLRMIESYPELMLIDVRPEEDYLKGHIPGAVNLPLLELVDWAFPINRWKEIVVIGDSYYQSKVAVETLRRLNFHRLFRLMSPNRSWSGELADFI